MVSTIAVLYCHAYEKMIRWIIFELQCIQRSCQWQVRLVEHLAKAGQRRSLRLVQRVVYNVCQGKQVSVKQTVNFHDTL